MHSSIIPMGKGATRLGVVDPTRSGRGYVSLFPWLPPGYYLTKIVDQFAVKEYYSMDTITTINKFRNPYGNQEIELQDVVYEAGGTPMLRLRIRERGARFTIFDIDPVTARFWADQMLEWSAARLDASQPEGH